MCLDVDNFHYTKMCYECMGDYEIVNNTDMMNDGKYMIWGYRCIPKPK